MHQWSFFVALVAGAALVAWAPAGRATAAAAIYAVALAGLLGTSALYHRITWQPRARAWLRRLDHAMIFVLIAGTYTPFALLVLDGPAQRRWCWPGVWSGAAAGIVFTLLWVDAPKWLAAATYVALGWFSIIAVPQITERAGAGALALLARGRRWRTRPERSSTRAGGPTRGPPRSATTRSSTCSWWSPRPPISRPWRPSRCPTAR